VGALLSANEAAELENITVRAIRKRIDEGKLKAVKLDNASGAGHGFTYGINLSDLSEKAQRNYHKRLKEQAAAKAPEPEEPKAETTLEDLTEKQRLQVAKWEKILKDWRSYIGYEHGEMQFRTKEFIRMYNIQNPDDPIKERTLYNKWEAYRTLGPIGLADKRCQSSKKGSSSIPDEAWAVFFQLWADENEPSINMCYRETEAFLRRELPELLPLPNIESFKRKVKQIPLPVAMYYRKGEKAKDDLILPYVQRDYQSIDSNEWWTSDYHTLDMMVRDDRTGEVFRPHVVVWLDIRSRKFLAWRVRRSSDSDGVVLAFKDAVKTYGIPSNVYLDNGREYLTHAFGGRGKRKTDRNADYAAPILDRMGITMHNAIPRNAKGKVVERTFRQFTEQFAKSFLTYCGNRPGNRPERHNEVLKNETNIPLLSEVEALLKTFIEGMHNAQASNAVGLNGKTPNEVYAANLYKQRVATADQINLLLMRSERLQKVQRNGVKVKIGGEELWFYNEELKTNYFGEKVYVRYDPDDLQEVRVYDEQERLLCTAQLLEAGGYDLGTDSESVKKVNSMRKKENRAILDYMAKQKNILAAPEAKDALRMVAEDNLAADESMKPNPKVLQPISWGEELAPTASGDVGLLDWDLMIENAKKNKGE